MVCETSELEEARGRTCWPVRQDALDSLATVDKWASRHMYYPFLLTLMTDRLFFGMTAGYFYESWGVITAIYGRRPWIEALTLYSFGHSLYTTPVDSLLQDPGYAIVGSLAAFALSNAMRRYQCMTWGNLVAYLFPWIHDPRGGPWWGLAKRVTFNLFVLWMFKKPADTLTEHVFGGPYRDASFSWAAFGSSNHAFSLIVIAVMLIAVFYEAKWQWCCTRWDYFIYAMLVLVGPLATHNAASGMVFWMCNDHYRTQVLSCSTFLWSNFALLLYVCASMIALAYWTKKRKRRRYK